MSVRSLCLSPHPVLRTKARPIERFTDELRRLIRDLIDTMHASDGIGLAAPQIGQDVQVFVVNPSQRRGKEVVVVNPVIERFTGRAAIVEGCLSVPDVWERVKRSAAVRIRAQDPTGRPLAIEAQGLLAIVLQHEFDHLQGCLFIDRISWFRRRRIPADMRSTVRAPRRRLAALISR